MGLIEAAPGSMPMTAHAQRGLSLVGLLFVGAIAVVLALLGARVVPAITEYIAVEKGIKRVAADGSTVAQIRRDFDNFAIVNDIRSIAGKDLDITKEDDQIVVAYAYSYTIQVADHVRLVIDFSGSTRRRGLAAQ